jgi:hypothetical protein
MLRTMGKTFGSAMAALCLVATLALAQSQTSASPMSPAEDTAVRQHQTQKPTHGQPQPMTCTKDDGKGTCTAAAGPDGREMVVVGVGMEKGASMTCTDRGNVVDCKPATT